MATRSPSSRRVVRVVAALAITGAAVAGFAGTAGASSTISRISAEACTGGTVERDVTVSYTTDASFTTGVRVHVVSGTPDGPTIDTVTVDLQGPVAVTIPFTLAPGTYYFDWEDRAGDRITWSGRHSGLGSFYAGIYASTRTVVEPCAVVVVASTTTTVTTTTVTDTTVTTTPAQATTTTAPSVPTTPSSPDVTPFAPPPTAQGSTTIPSTTPSTAATTSTTPSSTTVTTVPSTPAPPATAQSTVSVPPGATAVTGADPLPMLVAGTALLGLGTVALLVVRRVPGRSH